MDVIIWLVRLFQRPIRPGGAIMLEKSPSGDVRLGTYGCMVTHSGRKYLLSCAHVFERGKQGDRVISADIDARSRGRMVGMLGMVSRDTDSALVRAHWPARVVPGFPRSVGRVDPTPFPIDSLSFVPRNAIEGRVYVQALGAVSKHTVGFAATGVFSTLTYSKVPNKKGKAAGQKQSAYSISPPYIEVKPDLEHISDFCKEGDSGALLLTAPAQERPQPLGLLVALRKDGLGDFGLAVPIQRVLDDVGDGAVVFTGGQ